MSSIRVLFVEDEHYLQQFTTVALSQRGMKVFSAMDTLEADQVLAKEKVDVIVCDILMPAENGLSYVRRLRQKGHSVPVLFLSALAESDVKRIGIESGAADYMTKPFLTEDLYQRIVNLASRPHSTGYERGKS